jgi:hypothetical protein
MKKILFTALVLAAFASVAPASADSPAVSQNETAIRRSSASDTPIWKNRNFWHNEKERSGLPDFWQNTKSFAKKLNPVPFFRGQRDKYETNRTHSAVNDSKTPSTR